MTTPQPRTCRIILIAAVLVVMGRLLLCDFTWWDDYMTIHHNAGLNPVQWETFIYNWTTPSASIYIPLTHTVWALLTLIARVQPDDTGISLNPTFYHAANLLVHAGGAVAAWALLRRLVKNDLAALLGALLWAVHPVQVESVGWASGLKDVLSGSLVLTALVAFTRYRQDGLRQFYMTTVIVYALAMLAKPSAFTMPLLVVVIDRLILRTPWRKTLRALAPLLLITIPIAIVARQSQLAPAAAAPGWIRTLLVGDTLAFYIVKVIAPIHLTIDYGRPIEVLRAGRELYVAWLLPVSVAAVVAGVYVRRRRAGRPLSPLPAAALLMFVFAPLHVLGITRFDFQVISTVADHYLYVAMIGPALLLAWAIARWPKIAVTATIAIAVFGARAAWQTRVWQDSDTLFAHELAINPNSWVAYVNMNVLAVQRRDEPAAERYITAAERMAPDSPVVVQNLLSRSASLGDRDKTYYYARKLTDIYRRIYQSAGSSPALAYETVVGTLIDASRLDAADEFIQEGLVVDPENRELQGYAELLKWKRHALPPNAVPSTKPVTQAIDSK